MKPVSRNTLDLPVQPPHPLRLPATGRRARREGSAARALTVGLVILVSLVVGFVMLREGAAPPRAVENGQISRPTVGAIKYLTDGDVCRQATVDNSTGQITDLGRLACDQSKEVRPGGRLGSIRDSFKGR
jgi:hypothetical protein